MDAAWSGKGPDIHGGAILLVTAGPQSQGTAKSVMCWRGKYAGTSVYLNHDGSVDSLAKNASRHSQALGTETLARAFEGREEVAAPVHGV